MTIRKLKRGAPTKTTKKKVQRKTKKLFKELTQREFQKLPRAPRGLKFSAQSIPFGPSRAEDGRGGPPYHLFVLER